MIISKLSEPVKYVSEGHQTGYWDVVRAEQFYRARRGLSTSPDVPCYPGRYFFLWSTDKCQGSANGVRPFPDYD